MKSCAICNHPQLSEINENIDSGNYSLSQLKALLKAEFNLEVSNFQIREHKNKHKLPGQEIRKNAEIAQSSLADFDIFLAEYGLSRNDLYDVAGNMDKLITANQNIIFTCYMLNACLLKAKLESAIDRKAPYPRDEIGGLDKLQSVLERLTGLRQSIDVNAAIKTLESQGYRVEE